MLKQIKTTVGTRIGSSHAGVDPNPDVIARTPEAQGRKSARPRAFSAALGAGLVGLLLTAPVSWAQLGGGNPTPPPEPAPSSVVSFEASIITPENGQVV